MLKVNNKQIYDYSSLKKSLPIAAVFIYVLFCMLWIMYIDGLLMNFISKYPVYFPSNLIRAGLPILITSWLIYTCVCRSIYASQRIYRQKQLDFEITDSDIAITKQEKQNHSDRFNNISEMLRLEKDLTTGIIDNTGIFIILWDINGNLLRFNKYCERLTGFRQEEVLGMKWMDMLLDENGKLNFMNILSSVRKEGNLAQESKIKCKKGKEIYALWNNIVLPDGCGSPKMIVSIGIDITDHKNTEKKLIMSYQELEAIYEELAATEEELKENFETLQQKEQELAISEERYRLALDGSQDAVWDWDIKRGKSFVSDRWREMLGYSAEDLEVNHLTWKELIHPDDRERSFQAQQDHLNGKTSFYSSEYRLRMKNGEYKWIMVRGKALRDADGKPIRIAGSQTDISDRKNFEEKINLMAYYDSLTCLPNRAMLKKFLSQAMSEAKEKNLRGAVLFLDLDNFKKVNDTFGHSAGDELLVSAARFLKSFEKDGVKIFRILNLPTMLPDLLRMLYRPSTGPGQSVEANSIILPA